MKILKKLKPEERGLTRTLWEQVFTEDTKEFLDYYYTEKTKNNEIYVIETERTSKGGIIKAETQVERRERMTRKKRWERLDEDEAYSATQLDRDIVNPDQIRTVSRRGRPQIKRDDYSLVRPCLITSIQENDHAN